jgi:tRNA 2-thiouridine synthesizing protein A
MEYPPPNTTSLAYDLFLDVTHLECPIPAIKTKEALDTLPEGAVLKVLTDRESAVRNIHTFARSNGYPLFYESKTEEVYSLYIRKG